MWNDRSKNCDWNYNSKTCPDYNNIGTRKLIKYLYPPRACVSDKIGRGIAYFVPNNIVDN